MVKSHEHGQSEPQAATPAPSTREDDDDDEVTLTTRVTDTHLPAVTGVQPRDRATLTVVSGADTGRVYALAEITEIGRGPSCHVRIDDSSVSRVHTRITCAGMHYWLDDLDSRNGTFVDGSRVKRVELLDRKRIQLGPSVHFRFAISDEVEEQLMRGLYESSVRDALTGIYNRRHFSERIVAEIAYAQRHHTELTLILFDIDHFKSTNDDFGHPAGDRVLKSLAQLVGRTIRAEDIFCRFGGEEFAVLARGIEVRGAMALAERIRSIVETARIVHEQHWIPVAVSVGVATVRSCGEPCTSEKLISVADQRLYEAKLQGRNRVVGPG